jgi:hypothetical protein
VGLVWIGRSMFSIFLGSIVFKNVPEMLKFISVPEQNEASSLLNVSLIFDSQV